jgi:flagellar motor switch/type III secretory pathway protein FliN
MFIGSVWSEFCNDVVQMDRQPMIASPLMAVPPKEDPESSALAQSQSPLGAEDGPGFHGFGSLIGRLPVELEVAVPVREFRVRNLLSLAKGSVIETEWKHGEDLPLSAGDVQLAWSEFEVVEAVLAVRVTRLA